METGRPRPANNGITERWFHLLVRQSDVAVRFFAGHFPPKPGRRLEFPAHCQIRKFHLCYYQTGIFTAIDVDLNQETSPGNFVAHLAQSSPGSSGPQRCKLFRAELDLAFFAMCSATDLERERCRIAHFSQANVSACALACQITLRNRPMPQPSEVFRHQPNQKFAFNFAIVSHSAVQLCKATC